MHYPRMVMYLSLVAVFLNLAFELMQTIAFVSNLTLFYLFVHIFIEKRIGYGSALKIVSNSAENRI